MARKKKSSQKSRRSTRGSPTAGEDRGSVALTVVWMLTALATAAAMIVVAGLRVFLWQYPPEGDQTQPIQLMPGLFLIVALTTGLLCLILTPVVHRFRVVAPPRQVSVVAVVVSLLPLATLMWLYVL
jgi:hypothetical protein